MKLLWSAFYVGIIAFILFISNGVESLRYTALLVGVMFILLGMNDFKEKSKTKAYVYFGISLIFIYIFVFFQSIISS